MLLLLLLLPATTATTVTSASAASCVEFSVHSEYQSPIPGQSSNVVRWRFKESCLGAGGVMMEIDDSEQKVGCRAELYYNADWSLEQSDSFRWVRGEEVCSASQYDESKPVILGETIIPGDWLNRPLPFAYEAQKREVVVYEQIGTTRFAAYLKIQDQEISRAQARAQGMIRDNLQIGLDSSGRLYLVEVKRDSGNGTQELLMRQLWFEGDRFWLYEAKGGRQSWRVLEK